MSDITPIQLTEYKNKSWKKPQSLSFASKESFCPLAASEIMEAAVGLPVVFIRSGDGFLLVALQGFNQNQNLYVDANGGWKGMYCPKAYSFYPFCIASHDGKKIVCERTGTGLVSNSSDGNPFFDETGGQAAEFGTLVEQLGQHQLGLEHTASLVEQIVALDLLTDWPIGFESNDQTVALNGVFRVDEEKLNSLSHAEFGELRDSGALRVCYSHLISMFSIKILNYLHKSQDKTASIVGDALNFDSGSSLNFDNL